VAALFSGVEEFQEILNCANYFLTKVVVSNLLRANFGLPCGIKILWSRDISRHIELPKHLTM
jgi:hypothetical protein